MASHDSADSRYFQLQTERESLLPSKHSATALPLTHTVPGSCVCADNFFKGKPDLIYRPHKQVGKILTFYRVAIAKTDSHKDW